MSTTSSANEVDGALLGEGSASVAESVASWAGVCAGSEQEVGSYAGVGDGLRLELSLGRAAKVTVDGAEVGVWTDGPFFLEGRNDANVSFSFILLPTDTRVGEKGKSLCDRGTGAGD